MSVKQICDGMYVVVNDFIYSTELDWSLQPLCYAYPFSYIFSFSDVSTFITLYAAAFAFGYYQI